MNDIIHRIRIRHGYKVPQEGVYERVYLCKNVQRFASHLRSSRPVRSYGLLDIRNQRLYLDNGKVYNPVDFHNKNVIKVLVK